MSQMCSRTCATARKARNSRSDPELSEVEAEADAFASLPLQPAVPPAKTRPTLTGVWRLISLAGALAWAVIGGLLVVEGDALARAIGVVFLVAWLASAVRVYRRPQTKAEIQAARERLTRIYRRTVSLLRRPRVRVAGAAVILAAAFAGAAYLHWHEAVYHC